jgi:hypothetical protein
MMPPPYGPRRRPSQRTYFWRRVAVLGALGVVVVGIVVGALSVLSSTPPSATSTPTTGAGGSTAQAKPTTTVTTRPGNPVTVAAVGDTDLGSTPELPPSPSTYLSAVEPALKAPIVFGNLEGTLTDATGGKCGTSTTDCFAFHMPPSYASIFKSAGFTVMNSANNHSHDYGAQGVADTTAALQGAGIVQAGLPGQIGVVTEGTTKVAFVDFAPYTDVNNLLDLATAKTLITKAKSEANLVVVYMHAGAEGSAATHVTGSEETYVGEDRGNPEAFAHMAIDDGAALVIASGPHVLRGMEFYKGHLIAYSLGNFSGYHNFGTDGILDLSGILQVTLAGDGSFTSGHFTSTVLSSVGQPFLDSSDSAAHLMNQLSAADFSTDAATILPSGALSSPSSTP